MLDLVIFIFLHTWIRRARTNIIGWKLECGVAELFGIAVCLSVRKPKIHQDVFLHCHLLGIGSANARNCDISLTIWVPKALLRIICITQGKTNLFLIWIKGIKLCCSRDVFKIYVRKCPLPLGKSLRSIVAYVAIFVPQFPATVLCFVHFSH